MLVTGITGFVASHCVEQLLSEGFRIRGTTRDEKNEEKLAFIRKFQATGADIEIIQIDLLDGEAAWDKAVEGCDLVLHIASPFPENEPEDLEKELFRPAVEGTTTVIQAALKCASVKRVVMTSAYAACCNTTEFTPKEITEEQWADEEKELEPFGKSKVMAEKTAWKLVKNQPEGRNMELATIIPMYVMGPVIHGQSGNSQTLVGRLMNGKVPVMANVNYMISDVRDVARCHVRALTLPEAANQRFIVINGVLSMQEVVKTLADEFEKYGYKFPTRTAMNFMVRTMAIADRTLKYIVPSLGQKAQNFQNHKMKQVLGLEQPLDVKQTTIDMAHTMIEKGFAKKTESYESIKN